MFMAFGAALVFFFGGGEEGGVLLLARGVSASGTQGVALAWYRTPRTSCPFLTIRTSVKKTKLLVDDLVDLDVANKSRTWNEHFNCSVSTDRYISSSWEFSSFMWNVNDFQILFELHLRVFPCLCACVSVCLSSFFIFIFFRLLRKWLSLVRWRGG